MNTTLASLCFLLVAFSTHGGSVKYELVVRSSVGGQVVGFAPGRVKTIIIIRSPSTFFSSLYCLAGLEIVVRHPYSGVSHCPLPEFALHLFYLHQTF